MIDLQKIKDSIVGLTQQRESLKTQLDMVDGALQYCRQLIEEEEGAQVPSSESVVDEAQEKAE